MRFSNRKLFVVHLALVLVLAVVMFGTVPVQAEPFAYRVASDGAMSGNCGMDWSNPCALQYVLPLLTSGGELWVKEGIHKPGNDRNSTFRLMNGVAIYGGFAGTETARDQRDPSANVTILSGDLNGNDNTNVAHDEPTRAENVLHVFAGSGVDSSAILDGFTITGGNANLNYGTHSARGGGIWIGSGSPTITNVIFTGNSSLELGGGVYNENNSSPVLTNVIFTNNSSEAGGGLTNYRSSPTLTNVKFTNNVATYSGGGVLNLSQSNPNFVDVTIANNSAFTFGGGMSNYSSTPRISNSTFHNNHASGNPHPFHTFDTTAPFGGGLYNSFESNSILENTTFTGNTTGNVSDGSGGSSIGNQGSSLTLINVTIIGNYDGIMNDSSHSVIRNSIVWGMPSIYDDLNSSSTVSDSVIQNGFPGGTNIITTDPMLGSLGNYGGNTQTVPISTGSSAIDQGNASYCPATDQRGVTRPQGAACDIGAYEANGTFVPTPTNTPTTIPTVTPTPVTSCDQITAGPITISDNSMRMTVTNPLTLPVQIQDIFVVWNHDKGHQFGSDKTIQLMSVSLDGTLWNGNSSGPSLTFVPSTASYIPTGTSTITFNFHQAYENVDGTEEILINLATNGCQASPIHSNSVATNTPTITPTFTPTLTPTATFTPTITLTPTSTPPYSYNPLYLSLTGNQTVGGVSSADEDILKFDGTNWNFFFDGSDVGVGSSDLFGFSIVDSDTILMAFSSAVTVGGLTINPQDVVRFEATSLGSVTAGAFHMHLDGSDVGFDTTAEKIDSISLLSDGRLLVSTTGNPVVTGVAGGRDEDVLAFTSTSLGDVTSGSWAMYFDGSDVGLAETSGEDVDALDVVNGKVYLSTVDNFAVNGLAGADEDVFVCESISLGDVTSCNFLPTLYFDGSTWNLSANDVDAFNLLVMGPVPTATFTNIPTHTSTPTHTQTPSTTPTPTNTATIGPSPTFTNTPTATRTPIPTNTATIGPSPMFTNTPTATNTPGGSDVIFADGFESGTLSVWTSGTIDAGDLSVSAAAALVGSRGLQAVIDDTNTIYVTDDTPNAESRYRARFYFDPNSISMASGDAHFIFKGFMGSGTDVLQVELRNSAGAYQIRGKILNDSSAFVVTNWFTISDAPHVIELDWRSATGAGANNGGLTLWIDTVQQANLTTVDNDTSRIDRVRLGALAGMDVGTNGTYYFDAFESRRQAFIGP